MSFALNKGFFKKLLRSALTLLSGHALGLSSHLALAQNSAGGSVTSQRPVIDTPPVPLDWRKINWPTMDYQRIGISGGAALFTLHSASEKRVRISAIFAKGTFGFAQEQLTNLEALTDLIVYGGAGEKTYAQIQNFTMQQGITLETKLTNTGLLHISVAALREDFEQAQQLLADIILRPRFENKALDIWKKEKIDDFQSLLDASNGRKQSKFLEQEMAALIFGPNHLAANQIRKFSPKSVNSVSMNQVKNLYNEMINRAGSQFVLAGGFTSEETQRLAKFIATLPRKAVSSNIWLPDRPRPSPSSGSAEAPTHKGTKGALLPKEDLIPVKIIRKKDLTQASILFDIYTSDFGKINSLERTQFAILQEIFSSSGGVVGNDRFSKALRADTGISYGPYSRFEANALEPNTNVANWKMVFQSPNDRLFEAIELAAKTWKTFVTNGISQSELDKARISRMNRMMVHEFTVFDLADIMTEDILSGELPDPVGIEGSLGRLEQVTDPKPLNQLLARLANSTSQNRLRSAIVIFGNPDENQLKSLRSSGKYQIVEDQPFEALRKELQK